jgi:hypothetical protein
MMCMSTKFTCHTSTSFAILLNRLHNTLMSIYMHTCIHTYMYKHTYIHVLYNIPLLSTTPRCYVLHTDTQTHRHTHTHTFAETRLEEGSETRWVAFSIAPITLCVCVCVCVCVYKYTCIYRA